mmetsp:Transcript_37785/g.90767  ORF Transcript_37785/g.90767 Transcript_37785/m.90767 type:complete len:149 (+) Transcript_37785:50-496(+)
MFRMVQRGVFLDAVSERDGSRRRAHSATLRDDNVVAEFADDSGAWVVNWETVADESVQVEPTTMMLANMPVKMQEQDLENFLDFCGLGKSCRLIRMPMERRGSSNRGFAFLECSSHRQFLKARLCLDGQLVPGFGQRRLVAQAANCRR